MKSINKKRMIFVLCIIIGIFIILFVAALMLFHIPNNYEVIAVDLGCVTVEGEEIQYPPYLPGFKYLRYDYDAEQNNTWYFRLVSAAIKTVTYKKTDDAPTDAQIAKITFSTKEKECFSVIYAYDFYQKQIYAQKNGEWYKAGNTFFINKLIGSFYDDEFTTSWDWIGQSTFVFEEFVFYDRVQYAPECMDFENATFRYNLYWKPTRHISAMDGYTDTGFRITAPSQISSREQAIQLAAMEMDYENYRATALYDETCNYWMVEIVNAEGFDGSLSNENTEYLFENTYTLIIDDQGLVKERYRALTVFTPFLNKYWE